jgi:hypothetical protein
MKYRIIIILVFYTNSIYSQFWIAGDTTTYEINIVEEYFEQETKVEFDIDCDGLRDFNIESSYPVDFIYPWRRLSFYMVEGVEVYNSNTGFVTAIELGDTVNLNIDSLWTENLDFIYGTSPLGGYGQAEINNKYILFRKNDSLSKKYIFILFSNLGINFSIHHIISECIDNPLEIIENNQDTQEINIFPNPTKGYINLSRKVDEVKVYSSNGSLILYNKNDDQNIDIRHFPKGLYFVQILDKGITKVWKLVNE